MIDHFTILGQPRRPWLDPDALKETFHRITAERHPDRTGTPSDFAEVNAAYSVLRHPAARLRHLLELEEPAALMAAEPVPDALAEIFMRIATLRRAIDAFVQQQVDATTPLGKALLASARFALQRDVAIEIACLEAAQSSALEVVQAGDEAWEGRDAAVAARLAMVQQELAYLEKWIAQLREALFRLEAP